MRHDVSVWQGPDQELLGEGLPSIETPFRDSSTLRSTMRVLLPAGRREAGSREQHQHQRAARDRRPAPLRTTHSHASHHGQDVVGYIARTAGSDLFWLVGECWSRERSFSAFELAESLPFRGADDDYGCHGRDKKPPMSIDRPFFLGLVQGIATLFSLSPPLAHSPRVEPGDAANRPHRFLPRRSSTAVIAEGGKRGSTWRCWWSLALSVWCSAEIAE